MSTKTQIVETAVPTAVASRAGCGLSQKAAVLLKLVFDSVVYLGNAGFPGLLDDADASHAVVARETLQRHDFGTVGTANLLPGSNYPDAP